MNKEFDPNGVDAHEPGAKLDAGKIMAGLLLDFSLALTEVAKVCTHGAEKYSRGGWQFVPNAAERYADAEMRHLLKRRHEQCDQDSGLLHDAHKIWNALAALELNMRAASVTVEVPAEKVSEINYPIFHHGV